MDELNEKERKRLEKVEKFHKEQVKDITTPSLAATFIAGLAQVKFSKYLQPALKGLSEAIGRTVLETTGRKLTSPFLEEFAKRTGNASAQSLSNLIAAQQYRYTGSDAVVRFTKFFNASKELLNVNPQSFATYQIMTKMFQPNAKLSLSNYFLAMGMGTAQHLGGSYAKEKYAEYFPEQFVSTTKFVHNMYNFIPQFTIYYGVQFTNIAAGTQTAIKSQFKKQKDNALLGLSRILTGFMGLLPSEAIGTTYEMAKAITAGEIQQNAVGLQAIMSFKHIWEQYLSRTELAKIYSTQDMSFFKLKNRIMDETVRSRASEEGFQQFLHWLERADPNDKRLKGFIEDLNTRLGKYKTSAAYKRAGLEFVTFRDIAAGSIKFTDIMGYVEIPWIEPKDVLNKRIQHITHLLIEKGLSPDAAIGFGIFKNSQGKLVSLPPHKLQILKSIDYLSKNIVVPYLGFNPLSIVQAPQLLEKQFYRQAVVDYEPDKVVQTFKGWHPVSWISERILYKTRASRAKSIASQYTMLSGSQIRQILKAAGMKEQAIESFISIQSRGQYDDTFKQTMNRFIEIQTKNDAVKQQFGEISAYNAKKLFNTFRLAHRIRITESPDPFTLKGLVYAVAKPPSILRRTFGDKYTRLAKNQQEFINTVNEEIVKSRLIYIGKQPLLLIGNRTYDVSNMIPYAINIRKAQLSGDMLFTYAKQTGAIRMTKAPKQNALWNVPGYQDFNIGKTFYGEIQDMISSPFKYEEQLGNMQFTLHMQGRLGYTVGLKRTYSRALSDVDIVFATDQLLPESGYQALSVQLYHYGKLQGFAKYMSSIAKTDEQRRVFIQLANLLELSPAEQKVYSELVQRIQKGMLTISKDWLEEPLTSHGLTRKQVLLNFGQYLYQIGKVVKEEQDVIVKNLQDLTQQFFRGATTQQAINEIENFVSKQLVGQLSPYMIISSDNGLTRFFETLIDKYGELKIDEDFAKTVGKTIVGLQLNEKTAQVQTLVSTLSRREFNVVYPELGKQISKIFEPYSLEPIYKQANQYLSSITSMQYRDLLESVFGKSYMEHIYRSLKYGIPKLNRFRESDPELMNLLMSGDYFRTSEVPLTQNYEILVQGNRYLQLGEFTLKGTIKDIWRQLFPDMVQRKSDIGKQNMPSLFLHWAFGRTSKLLEELGLGNINILQARNQWQEFKGVIQKLSWIGAAVQTLGVADQIITSATGGLINPHQALVSAQNNVQTGAVQVANWIGLGPAQRHLHQTMPGFISSIGALYGMQQGGIRGMFFLQSLGALQEHIPYTREFVLQSEGVMNVPVYQAQGWEFGREPYWGGRVKEYRPSLWYLQKKEWQYTPLMYGSKLEYQVFGQPYPTPLNLFGLIPLFSHHYDKKLLMYRPYPQTGNPPGTYTFMNLAVPGLTDNPAWALANFAVRALMPRESLLDEFTEELRRRNLTIYNQEPTVEQVQSYVAQQYLNERQLQVRNAVGFNSEHTQSRQLMLRQKAEQLSADYFKNIEYSVYRIQDLADWFADYLGFIGFAQNMLNPFGQTSGMREIKIQTSDYYRTSERLYYQQQLGNVFGLTEFYRRMNQSQRRMEYQINPLPNPYMILNFPWLPDRFLQGDQYQKVNFGEVRLPGPGYEYIRGSIDQYGPIDIFRILANVQPYSKVTDVQQQIAEKIQKDETTDPRIRYIIQQQKEERERIQEGFRPNERPFNMKLEERTYKVTKYLGGTQFETAQGEIVEIRGLSTDVDYIAKRIFERKNVSIEEAYRQAQLEAQNLTEYFQSLEGQEITVLVPKDKGLRYRYYGKDDIRTQAIMPGLKYSSAQQKEETAVDIRQNHRSTIWNRMWEHFQHQFGFFHEKFIPVRSQEEEYARYYTYGQYRALWQKPISDIVLPAVLNTVHLNPVEALVHGAIVGNLMGANFIARTAFGGMGATLSFIGSIFVPDTLIHPNTQQAREIEEDTITLEHLQGKRTFADYKNLPTMRQMQKLLPLRDKWQLEHLQNQPAKDWDKILTIAPDYMKPMLQEIYEAKMQMEQEGYPETEIEEDAIQFYQQNVYNDAISRIPQDVMSTYDLIDPEQYRTLLQMNNLSNLSIMNIYENQMALQLQSMLQVNSRMQYNYYDSQMYYVRQNAEAREQIYQSR